VPRAIVLCGSPPVAGRTLSRLRADPRLAHVPVLFDGSRRGDVEEARTLAVDGVAHSEAELERLLTASLGARKHLEREELTRRRLELILEITRASARREPLVGLEARVATRLKDGLGCTQVRLVSLPEEAGRPAELVDEAGRTPVDLAMSPVLRTALESRLPGGAEGLWVYPVPGDGPGVVAVQLKRETPLEQEERDVLDAVGIALRSAAEQARHERSLARARESLESAYVERYRELVQANERLKTLDRRKDELLAVLSHDLRAPLNVLLGHAFMLLDDPALPRQHRASAEAIQRTSRKVLELVENLLENRRGDAQQLVLFTKTLDVSEVVQEAVRELQILAREQGVRLRAEAPMSLLVLGDEQRIRQVLQNLVTNALKHARGLTEVVVRARLKPRPDGDVALVEVQDDGAVLDPNDVLLAFERSKGLGLSICKEYVARHGGELWAEARPVGGAVFSFTLPIKQERPTRSTAPRTDVPLVLLADDDPVFARICTLGLSGHYRVEHARDGLEVVDRARALNPDVIIMGVFMPRRDGLEALRLLKAEPDTAGIPVVLVSGNAELSDKLRSMELGAFDTLTKPFPLNVLLTRVGAALQRTHSRSPSVSVGNDAETGLFDQLGMVNRLEQELARSVRYGRPLSLAVLKPTMPPLEKTRLCAALVRRELRSPDVVGHLGHGVLVVLLPETPDDAARPLIGRLCSLLEGDGVSYRSRVVDVREGTQGAEALLEQLLG
jgi:signal transduction histidine kinase/DNA-binding response OmpR family regulator